jgi:GT2 family glycosyltransferase
VPWIIVLTWNGRERLPISLRPLATLEGDHEVLVVDNGSTDGSADEARRLMPRAHVLENGRNLGFAEGNNRGIAYALQRGATHVALVNDDMALDPGWLAALLADERAHPEAGILGGRVLFLDRPDVINSTGIEVDRCLRSRDRDFDRPLAQAPTRAAGSVLAVTGGAMLIARRVLEGVGSFDGSLFAYCEDYDLCLRARARGFGVRYVPGAVSYHKFAATLGTQHPFRRYLLSRNQMIMVGRHAPALVAILLLPATALYRALLRAPAFLLSGRPGLCRAEAKAAVHGLGRGLRELIARAS